MYPLTLYTLTRNYPLFLLVAAMLTLVEASGLSGGTGTSMIVYGLVALFSHRMVLLNENYGWDSVFKGPQDSKPPILRFLLTYIAFTVVATVISLGLVFPLLSQSSFMLITLAIFAVFGVLIAFFGTIFPAAATGGEPSLAAALDRGKRSFQKTLIRLLLGPVIAGAIGTALVVALAQVTGPSIIVTFAACLVSLIPTHMTAVILSMVYSETERGSRLPG